MRFRLLICVGLVLAGCGGGSGEDESGPTTEAPTTTVDDGADDDATDGEAATSGASSASGSVSIDGATYDFSDVVECEVGSDWGPDWRSFVAWSDDGHVHASITLGTGDGEFLTDFFLAVGLANPRTLDEGNPDQEWSTDFGGSVSSVLTETGASGTADVATLGPDGAVDGVADWSFTC